MHKNVKINRKLGHCIISQIYFKNSTPERKENHKVPKRVAMYISLDVGANLYIREFHTCALRELKSKLNLYNLIVKEIE